jgi:hypothetical protein
MLMRATGRGSISSFLKLAVDIAWVIACALLGFIWIIAAVTLLSSAIGVEWLGGLKEIALRDPIWGAIAVFNGTVLCTAAMVICAYLRGVFETLIEGDAFVLGNARRFRNIAIVMAVIEVVRMAGRFITPLLYQSSTAAVESESSGGPLDLSGWFATLIIWFAVLTLLVLAQVFREGALLREEQKMTI